MTRDEAIQVARTLLDYRADFVEDAKRLARYVVGGEDADGVLVANERVVELESQRNTLQRLIESIANADPYARDGEIAAALTAARGMQ